MDSIYFPPFTTPLMVAARQSKSSMIKLLLERGHTLRIPHNQTCQCPDCYYPGDSSYSKPKRDVQMMRALAEPEYINTTEKFPILKCLELSFYIRRRMKDDFDAFYQDFKKILEKMEIYCCDLLYETRESDEIHLILSQQIEDDPRTQQIQYPVSI